MMMMMKRGAQQSRQKTSDLNFNVVFVPPRCSFVAHIHSEKMHLYIMSLKEKTCLTGLNNLCLLLHYSGH